VRCRHQRQRDLGREFASVDEGYSSTGAPLVVKDKILVGVTGGGSGSADLCRDFRRDGQRAWRFWTVPAKGEPGSETWAQFPLEIRRAPTWTTGSYDPESNVVYWPTGNPVARFYGGGRVGDNLYPIAWCARRRHGQAQWLFQFTPHDTHDWDANETAVLIWRRSASMTKLLVQAPQVFYYVLGQDPEFLAARRFVEKMNWASGLDAKGRSDRVAA